MNSTTFMQDLVAPYVPLLSIDQLVLEINKLYHRFEADIYEVRHPEIYQQLPALWQEMISTIAKHAHTKWRILNFGCGTGFEAQQLLQHMPKNSISALTCYDPSPEMIDLCRTKIAPLFPKALFCTSLEDVQLDEPYTLLATNSVLHHLPDVPLVISSLLPLISSDAVWLAGHEPSYRFYKNDECVKNFNAFLQRRRWSLSNYIFLIMHRLTNNTYAKTAQEAVRVGLFRRRPPASVIDRLVDFHVAHSALEISAGRGFDIESMQRDFQGWHLTWLKTYSFMGPFYEGSLSERWVRLSRELEQRFPRDGANFCMVWQRCLPDNAKIGIYSES